MKTSEPILTRGRDAWDTVNMPVRAFDERMERVRAAMDREGLDALMLFGTGDRDGDIAYVSNLVHKVPGFPLALVVTAETAVVLNQRSSRTRPIVERSTWIEDVRFTRDLWAEFDDVLADVADADDAIGFVGADAMAQPARDRLDELASSWQIKVRDGFLDELRAVKDRRERDQIRRSGRILGTVAGTLDDSLDDPTSEHALAAELDGLARLHGAQDVRMLISNPGHTEGAHRPPEAVPIEAGDRISVYLAARYEGYWSSLARTTTLDEPDESNGALDAAEGVLDDLVESIEPGRDAPEILGEADRAVEELGFDLDPRYPLLTGIGLELDEPPVVRPGDDGSARPVETGMCFEVMLPISTDDGGPILVGDTVVVTEDGAERVTIDLGA